MNFVEVKNVQVFWKKWDEEVHITGYQTKKIQNQTNGRYDKIPFKKENGVKLL